MLDRHTQSLYTRLGRRYRLVFCGAELIASTAIALIAVALMLSYYRHSAAQALLIYVVVCGAVAGGVVLALFRGLRHLEPTMRWLAQPPGASTPAEGAAAWDAATNYPMRAFRANSLIVGLIAAVPTVAFVTAELHLRWSTALALLVSTLIPIAYGIAVNYAIAEQLMRPLVAHVAATLPEDFPFAANGLLLHQRLKLLLVIFSTFVGQVVAAIMRHGGGTAALLESLGVAVGVGIAFSFELLLLVSRSVTAPVADLRRGLAGIKAMEYGARVPVLSSDEMGELSHDFNLMASGLAERETMREAFSTYLDRDVVGLILSGSFPDAGVEVTVSIMFVDVRGFTAFAEALSPTQVVAALNGLFEVIVPVIRRHGGHVDKFLGDGLLAVFGAPEGYADHADRAVAAGLDLIAAIERADLALSVGVGINSGPVVAGSIGGAGRLNFSVIGDAVNVAARVEAATRSTGDQLLLTARTRDALTRPHALIPRGRLPLRGKQHPVELLTCAAIPSGADAEIEPFELAADPAVRAGGPLGERPRGAG